MDKNKKIILIVAAGIFLIAILSFVIYYFSNYDTIICNGSDGSIILVYDEDNLVNFGTTKNMSFDFENQKSYVEKIGVKNYIKAFKNNYEVNLSGKCKEL